MSSIANQEFDGLLISGDIAESGIARDWLRRIANQIDRPVYFVLGNHDFYDESISVARQDTVRICRDNHNLHYLTDCSAIQLVDPTNRSSSPTYLVGEDAWGDATKGDYDRSFVKLADFERIADFLTLDAEQRKSYLQKLGRSAAERLAEKLKAIPKGKSRIIVLTHVPPFVEACWYQGKTADQHWSPFFVCGQTGDVLLSYAKEHPNCEIAVLCGHCHHSGVATPLSNLVIYTAEAAIGHPSISGVVEVSGPDISVKTTGAI